MEMLDAIRVFSDVIIDSYFVVDAERTIVDFNQAFFSLLPRAVARGLRGRKCHEVLHLDICGERCIAQQCFDARKHIRLDEIGGRVASTERRLTFILSAIPIPARDGTPEGVLVVHRNVTDEAQVQLKYQEMLETERRERERLLYIIRSRTKDLLKTSSDLFAAQKELMAFRRGRLL